LAYNAIRSSLNKKFNLRKQAELIQNALLKHQVLDRYRLKVNLGPPLSDVMSDELALKQMEAHLNELLKKKEELSKPDSALAKLQETISTIISTPSIQTNIRLYVQDAVTRKWNRDVACFTTVLEARQARLDYIKQKKLENKSEMKEEVKQLDDKLIIQSLVAREVAKQLANQPQKKKAKPTKPTNPNLKSRSGKPKKKKKNVPPAASSSTSHDYGRGRGRDRGRGRERGRGRGRGRGYFS
jgi:hypothetical protein